MDDLLTQKEVGTLQDDELRVITELRRIKKHYWGEMVIKSQLQGHRLQNIYITAGRGWKFKIVLPDAV